MTDLIREYLNSKDLRLHGSNVSVMPGENGNVLSPGTFPGNIFGGSYPQMDPNETPEEMGQRMSDAQQNTALGNVLVGGAKRAVQGAVDYGTELLELGGEQFLAQAGLTRGGEPINLSIPKPVLFKDTPKPEGVLESIAQDFAQFGAGMVISPAKTNVIKGMLSGTYFDPENGAFISGLRELGIGKEALEFLDFKVGADASTEDRIIARMFQGLEEGVLTAFGEGIIGTLKQIKKTPALLEKARGAIIQAGKNAEARMAEGGVQLNTGFDPDPLIAGAGKMLDNTRQQDELGFYSKALDVINKISLNKASSQQWMQTLINADVKKDEMYWTGLDEFFKRKGNQVITKGELIDYINQNQVQLKEVRLGVDGDMGDGGSLGFQSDEGSIDFRLHRDEEINIEAEYIREDLFYFVHRAYDESFDGPVFEGMKTAIFKEFQKEDLLAVGIDRNFTSPEEISKMVINPTDQLQPQFSGMGLPKEYTFDDVIDKILRQKFNADSDFDKMDEWFVNNKKAIEEEQDIPVVILDKINPRIFKDSGYKEDAIIEDIATDQMNNYGEFVMESADAGDATYRIIGGGNRQEFQIYRDNQYVDSTDDLNEARVIAQQDVLEQGGINYPEDIEPGSETAGDFDGPAQFANQDWRESGGSNYREILLTSPNIRDATKTNFEIIEGDARTGQHHSGYKNIIAHLRITDRITSDGKRVLYIDEIQSDWSRKGTKSGFKKSEQEIQEILDKRAEAQKIVDAGREKVINQGTDLVGEELDKANQALNYLQETSSFLPSVSMEGTASDIAQRQGAFDKGPFVEDVNKWTQMTMKRVLRMAIDEGYDAIAWTPGKVQTERWGNKSTSIQKLEVYTIEDLNVLEDENKAVFMIGNLVDGDGNIVMDSKPVSYMTLKKLFGQQGADKIVGDLRTKFDDDGVRTMQYENPNIKFILQSFYNLYDEIVPNKSKPLIRKLDKSAKVENIEVEGLGMRKSIKITDKMKESVKGGQPLFTGPAVVGAGATGAVMANQGAEDGNTN